MRELDGIAGITRSIATSSALNPTLILAAICTPASLVLSRFSSGYEQVALLAIAGAVPLVALAQIVWFTIKSPDRLQHENHVENKMLISRMGENSNDGARQILIDNNTILTENPKISDESQKS